MAFEPDLFSKRVTSYGSRLELIPSTNRITKGSKSRVVQSTLRSKFHARVQCGSRVKYPRHRKRTDTFRGLSSFAVVVLRVEV